MKSPSISYIYACRNRKCKSFKKEVVLDFSPTDHLAETSGLPSCVECRSPLKYLRMDYPKEVFRNKPGKVDLSLSDGQLSDIIKTAEKTVQEEDRGKKTKC